MDKNRICQESEIGEGQSRKFVMPGEREGFLIRHRGALKAYFNECAHISLPLDWGDNDFFSSDGHWLVCKNHGAMYDPATGMCTGGPCTGVALKAITVIVENGAVYAGD